MAATSTSMPRIETSRSASYSPSPASAVASERQRQERRRDAAGEEDHHQRERQVVDDQRVGDDRLVDVPLPDREPGRDAQRHQGQHRHDLRRMNAPRSEADEQHDARAHRPARSNGESASQSIGGPLWSPGPAARSSHLRCAAWTDRASPALERELRDTARTRGSRATSGTSTRPSRARQLERRRPSGRPGCASTDVEAQHVDRRETTPTEATNARRTD